MTTLPATTAASGRPDTRAQSLGNTAVVAAVVSVVIIAAMLSAVIGLVMILVIFRRRRMGSATAAVLYTNDGEDSLKELDNPMYSATSGNQTKQYFKLYMYSNKRR